MPQPTLEEADPLLHKAIEIEKAKIKVQPYYDTVMIKSFGARAQGMFSGMVLGALIGLAVGATALAIVPGINMMAGIGLLAKFAVGGMGIGGLAGQIIGSSAGAAAAAAEERERREKGQGLEAQILSSPELQQSLREKYAEDGLPKDMPAKNFREVLERSRNGGDIWKQMFNGRNLMIVGGIGAILGALIGAAGDLPFDLAKDAALSQQALYGAGMFGVSGMAFGINFPVLFTTISKWTGDLLSGKLFEAQTEGLSPELELRLQQELGYPPISKSHGTRLEELRARGYTPTTPQQPPAESTPPKQPSAAQIHDAVYIERLQTEMGRGTPTVH